MNRIGERIRLILDRQKISDKTVAGWLGISPQRLSQKFRDGIWDSIAEVDIIANQTGYAFEWIKEGSGPEMQSTAAPEVQEVSIKYLNGDHVRPLTVTVSASGQELVSYVPVKARAGYMRGYADPHFIERLPAFSLPGVIKDQATYRMFEVEGDSMRQLGNKGLTSGDIIIARYVEDIFTVRDNRVYVVITPDGIAIKRILNRLKDKESPSLVLMSDNKSGDHATYLVKPKQILEVWEAKKVISSDFSFDTDLYQIIGDIQAEQAKLKEELHTLKQKK